MHRIFGKKFWFIYVFIQLVQAYQLLKRVSGCFTWGAEKIQVLEKMWRNVPKGGTKFSKIDKKNPLMKKPQKNGNDSYRIRFHQIIQITESYSLVIFLHKWNIMVAQSFILPNTRPYLPLSLYRYTYFRFSHSNHQG